MTNWIDVVYKDAFPLEVTGYVLNPVPGMFDDTQLNSSANIALTPFETDISDTYNFSVNTLFDFFGGGGTQTSTTTLEIRRSSSDATVLFAASFATTATLGTVDITKPTAPFTGKIVVSISVLNGVNVDLTNEVNVTATATDATGSIVPNEAGFEVIGTTSRSGTIGGVLAKRSLDGQVFNPQTVIGDGTNFSQSQYVLYSRVGLSFQSFFLKTSIPAGARLIASRTRSAPMAYNDKSYLQLYIVQPFVPPTRIDAFTDPHGVMFSAVKEGTGVRVSRFPNGMASREKLALVPNLSSPSLCQHNTQAGEHQECDAAIYLLGKDATASVWKMFVSDDDGETFDFMANSPFDGTYKVIGAPIGHGCTGLIAVKGTEVTFARTGDGVNYDTFANGTKINSVGDLGASVKTLSFHSEFAFGTDYLKVSNGVDWARGSDDGGDTWDVI